jgi:Homeodomain-like domain
MAAWRRAIELSLGDSDTAKLRSIAQLRTVVERARILLAYREDPSFFAVGRALGLHHQTVQRCVERAVAEGPTAALDDRPRPGREPTITLEAKAWLVSLACRKAKDLGYPHELWTTRLLARHAREHGPAQGHACVANLAQGTVCKILDQEEVKPHKVRYYLEQRDPDFAEKMAEVLCVYRKVKILKQAATVSEAKKKPSDAVAIISYDEKPGIQAIATTAPDLPPEPSVHATFAREHEYKRYGTVSLLAGIDLVIGITSSLPNEGKSTIAMALAEVIAHGGGRVVLVDCDLRNPSLTRKLAPGAEAGFLDVRRRSAQRGDVDRFSYQVGLSADRREDSSLP